MWPTTLPMPPISVNAGTSISPDTRSRPPIPTPSDNPEHYPQRHQAREHRLNLGARFSAQCKLEIFSTRAKFFIASTRFFCEYEIFLRVRDFLGEYELFFFAMARFSFASARFILRVRDFILRVGDFDYEMILWSHHTYIIT